MFKTGFKFKPTFTTGVKYFEVRGYDKERDMVLTIVYNQFGSSFNDEIERIYYEAAFERGDYVSVNE